MDHGSDWFGRELGDKRGRQPITDWNPPEEMNKYVDFTGTHLSWDKNFHGTNIVNDRI